LVTLLKEHINNGSSLQTFPLVRTIHSQGINLVLLICLETVDMTQNNRDISESYSKYCKAWKIPPLFMTVKYCST
jgi:hypothetical protein